MTTPQPPRFRIDPRDPAALADWLRARGWLAPDEPIEDLALAGEGNMNLTLRVVTPARSFIVKQSRPYVEKYPHIPAPAERVSVEAAFYRTVAEVPALARAMPRLLGADDGDRVLLLEDLGEASDLMSVYRGVPVAPSERRALLSWLGTLHALRVTDPDPLLANRAMRELNHAHIFELPLGDVDLLDLDAMTPGLAAEAARLRHDRACVDIVRALGRRYLGGGDSLLHGDFYPGSWLRTPAGIRVIDPEFCFVGPPEFDVGVMLGHAILGGESPDEAFAAVTDGYEAPAGFDGALAGGFAGVEVIRRLIGVAQLPISAGIHQKREWLAVARQLVLEAAGVA
ncbi:MAG: phosphotransferase [Deltaproteobacteria bacterium]|nr:phosphotransferase [Deltaproteobacteria bacterium]